MKQMKKSLALLMVAVLFVFPLTACGGGADDDVLQIGIIQIMEHPAMDDARFGFIQALADEGFVEERGDGEEGILVEFDYINAQGDASVMTTIAQRFVGNDVNLILTLGTGAVQRTAAETETIPIVGSAITNYVLAGVAESNERPGGNVTGASDMKPVEAQIQMIPEFVPDIQSLGILWNSGEANSEYQAEIATRVAEEMGLTVVHGAVTGPADVQLVTASVASQVDAIYIPTDNTFATAMNTVAQISLETGVPVFAAEANMVMGGGLATLSFSYYDLGYKSGLMAAQILRGESDPAEMPIQFSTDLFYIINGFMAEELGIVIPPQFEAYIRFPE